jgi:Zn-dependent protease with chaperone function
MVAFSYFVMLILAAVCVGIPLWVLTYASNFQTLALFVAGGIVAGAMLWSMVPRRDTFVAPGLLLERENHPRLFAMIDEIAQQLNEPLPAEIYLIGNANAWVADRGGWMGFGSRRVMGLGLPLLAALNVSQFKAVLAHEFAHYYGGDTKLGPWVHRAQMAMVHTFQNMGSVGKAMRFAIMQGLYVIVFGILKAYWKLFLRAINFVSRRQEFRADELACYVAGPDALVSGLRGIHGTNLAWPAFINTELEPMLEMGYIPPIAQGFAQFLTASSIAEEVKKQIAKEEQGGKTEPFDSHPPLKDRIAAAQSLNMLSPPRDRGPAFDLLSNLGSEEVRFLQVMNPDMTKKPFKIVGWEEHAPVVLIPAWSRSVSEYSHLLNGMTIGNVPTSLGQIPLIAPQIRDPEGMLLTPEQRIQRARSLLATALALALVQAGATVHSMPGEFHLTIGGEQLNPFTVMLQLSDGAISKEDWLDKCKSLGIEDIALAHATPEVSTAKAE